MGGVAALGASVAMPEGHCPRGSTGTPGTESRSRAASIPADPVSADRVKIVSCNSKRPGEA